MNKTTMTTPALYHRSAWQKDIDDNKIDMGLLPPIEQDQLDHDLVRAVIEGHRPGVREMAALGADVNRRLLAPIEGTPLHLAAAEGSLKIVVTLLQLGADPFATDSMGRTPRALTAVKGRSGAGRVRTILKLWELRQRGTADGGDDARRLGT